MEFGFREKGVLGMFARGLVQTEVAILMGIKRCWITNRVNRDPLFALAYEAARILGRAERSYRVWLRCPRRGKRPPTGKGNGGVPRFRYGRR